MDIKAIQEKAEKTRNVKIIPVLAAHPFNWRWGRAESHGTELYCDQQTSLCDFFFLLLLQKKKDTGSFRARKPEEMMCLLAGQANKQDKWSALLLGPMKSRHTNPLRRQKFSFWPQRHCGHHHHHISNPTPPECLYISGIVQRVLRGQALLSLIFSRRLLSPIAQVIRCRVAPVHKSRQSVFKF